MQSFTDVHWKKSVLRMPIDDGYEKMTKKHQFFYAKCFLLLILALYTVGLFVALQPYFLKLQAFMYVFLCIVFLL